MSPWFALQRALAGREWCAAGARPADCAGVPPSAEDLGLEWAHYRAALGMAKPRFPDEGSALGACWLIGRGLGFGTQPFPLAGEGP